MKKLFFLFIVFLPSAFFAQSPDYFSYQGVVRDANSNSVMNSNIGMQISILRDSMSVNAEYVERHFPQTNENGLVSLKIGGGVIVSGNFGTINWGDGPYFLRIETDLNGGANYTISGMSQLLSVPFSMYAKNGKELDQYGRESMNLFNTDSSYATSLRAGSIRVMRLGSSGGNYANLGSGSGTDGGNLTLYSGYKKRIELSTWRQGGRLAFFGNDNSIDPKKIFLYVLVDNGNEVGVISTDRVHASERISAPLKNFVLDHPNDSTKQIWYCAIEGPEAAAYERGTGEMINGEAFIEFPEHYQLVANPNTMTIQITPLSANSKGVAVVEKNETGFLVKELYGGTGSYFFDWRVECIRKGFENYKVVRPK